MKEYKRIPVEICRQLSADFDKEIVIVCAWDSEHEKLHTTTYGKEPQDKINAARGGEICAKALGCDLGRKEDFEDFRTMDAARNAQFRDLAPGLIHVLRSYQFGNGAPEPSKDWADRLEALIK